MQSSSKRARDQSDREREGDRRRARASRLSPSDRLPHPPPSVRYLTQTAVRHMLATNKYDIRALTWLAMATHGAGDDVNAVLLPMIWVYLLMCGGGNPWGAAELLTLTARETMTARDAPTGSVETLILTIGMNMMTVPHAGLSFMAYMRYYARASRTHDNPELPDHAPPAERSKWVNEWFDARASSAHSPHKDDQLMRAHATRLVHCLSVRKMTGAIDAAHACAAALVHNRAPLQSYNRAGTGGAVQRTYQRPWAAAHVVDLLTTWTKRMKQRAEDRTGPVHMRSANWPLLTWACRAATRYFRNSSLASDPALALAIVAWLVTVVRIAREFKVSGAMLATPPGLAPLADSDERQFREYESIDWDSVLFAWRQGHVGDGRPPTEVVNDREFWDGDAKAPVRKLLVHMLENKPMRSSGVVVHTDRAGVGRLLPSASMQFTLYWAPMLHTDVSPVPAEREQFEMDAQQVVNRLVTKDAGRNVVFVHL